jgi:hypothetical protein
MSEWKRNKADGSISLKIYEQDPSKTPQWSADGNAELHISRDYESGEDRLIMTWSVDMIAVDGKPGFERGSNSSMKMKKSKVWLIASGMSDANTIPSGKQAAEAAMSDAIRDLAPKMRAALAALGEDMSDA